MFWDIQLYLLIFYLNTKLNGLKSCIIYVKRNANSFGSFWVLGASSGLFGDLLPISGARPYEYV
jgi:hypothetical protein